MEKSTVLLAQGDRVQSGDKIWTLGEPLRDGSGGEGTIFELEGDSAYVAKIFREKKNNDKRFEKLKYMVNMASSNATGRQLRYSRRVTWPQNVLCDAETHAPVGYRMRRIDGQSAAAGFMSRAARNRTFEDWGISENPWKLADLLQACINMLRGFKELHEKNVLMADVNAGNVLFDRERRAYLVDTDSYQLGSEYPCLVGKEEYISPRYREHCDSGYDMPREPEDEYYAITVLLFQLLTAGTHPYENQEKEAGLFPYHLTFNLDRGEPLPQWYADTWQGSIQNSILRDNYQPECRRVWNHMPHRVKTAFFKTFVPEARTEEDKEDFNSPGKWIGLLRSWQEQIKKGEKDNELWPEEDKAVQNEDGELIVGEKDYCIICGKKFDRRMIYNPQTRRKEPKQLCDLCEKIETDFVQFYCVDCGRFVEMQKKEYDLEVLEGARLRGDYTNYHKCPQCIALIKQKENKLRERDCFIADMELVGNLQMTIPIRFCDLKTAGYMKPIEEQRELTAYEKIMLKYRPQEEEKERVPSERMPSEHEAAVRYLLDRVCELASGFRIYSKAFAEDFLKAEQGQKLRWSYSLPQGALIKEVHFFYWEKEDRGSFEKIVYVYLIKA